MGAAGSCVCAGRCSWPYPHTHAVTARPSPAWRVHVTVSMAVPVLVGVDFSPFCLDPRRRHIASLDSVRSLSASRHTTNWSRKTTTREETSLKIWTATERGKPAQRVCYCNKQPLRRKIQHHSLSPVCRHPHDVFFAHAPVWVPPCATLLLSSGPTQLCCTGHQLLYMTSTVLHVPAVIHRGGPKCW